MTTRHSCYLYTILSLAFVTGSATLAFLSWTLGRKAWRPGGCLGADILLCVGALIVVGAAKECFLDAREAWAYGRDLRDTLYSRPRFPGARALKHRRPGRVIRWFP